jgi:hypothetical protein
MTRRIVGVDQRLPDITGQMRPERTPRHPFRIDTSPILGQNPASPVSVTENRASVERRQAREYHLAAWQAPR